MYLELNALATERPRTLTTRQKPILVFTLRFLREYLTVRVQSLGVHPPLVSHKQFVS